MQLQRLVKLEMLDTVVSGTRRLLQFAQQIGCKRVLFVSSGAVYGRSQSTRVEFTENDLSGPDTLNARNAYAESKRLAEMLCTIYAKNYGLEIPIARCFAFVGPFLNLDIHYAIGNFIRDGLSNRTIEVKGDGRPLRSYLYPTDLMEWLITILVNGKSCQADNVGSNESISIGNLANLISKSFPGVGIVIRQAPVDQNPPESYVPSILKIRHERGLKIRVQLNEAIDRTIRWNQFYKPTVY